MIELALVPLSLLELFKQNDKTESKPQIHESQLYTLQKEMKLEFRLKDVTCMLYVNKDKWLHQLVTLKHIITICYEGLFVLNS